MDAFIALATDAKGAFDQRPGQALLEAYDTLVSIKRTAMDASGGGMVCPTAGRSGETGGAGGVYGGGAAGT